MASKFLVKQTFVDATQNCIFGSTEFEPFEVGDERGDIYKYGQREHGRCQSKMYIEKKDGTVKEIGWVFEKRVAYEGRHSRGETYLQQVWLEVVELVPVTNGLATVYQRKP
jgi:hypothetical protein